MLTDIFARRYEQPRMWETMYEEQRRLLVQGCQLLKDLCPYYVGGNEDQRGKDFWTRIQQLLGSGLIDQSQKITVAAMQMADMKVCAHRS